MRNFESEVVVKTSRSSGSGGQNVNKVETRVELVWQPANSKLFTEEEHARLLAKIAKRLDKEGLLHITAQVKRSQLENKYVALKKLAELVEKLLEPELIRKKTKLPAAVKNAIRRNKIFHSEKKAGRRKNYQDL